MVVIVGLTVIFGNIQGLVNVLWNGFYLCAKFTLNLVQGEPGNVNTRIFNLSFLDQMNVI